MRRIWEGTVMTGLHAYSQTSASDSDVSRFFATRIHIALRISHVLTTSAYQTATRGR